MRSPRGTAIVAAMSVMAAVPLGSAPRALAADLGVRGALFPIIEVDLLDLIGAKLKAAKASGKIEALNQAFAKRSVTSVERPAAVPGLSPTHEPRSWLYDPTFIVPHDYADQNGRVFARAGDRINPLMRMPGFDRVMVFLDGDDARQVAYALSVLHQYGAQRTRLILVKGSPVELMRREKTPVFFDQLGLLTDKFRLTQVPAVIVREGDRLRISEVRP
jgi:conjugal transfer pilus assembly protein TraW